MTTFAPSRRQVVAGGGALIVSMSLGATRALAQAPQASPPTQPLPGSLKGAPMLNSWIRIDADGAVTVFTGKAELGQGIKTALLQVASEELGVAMPRIKLVTADTATTPDEGYTSGSQSMPNSATAIRNAAAQVRDILLARAAERLSVNVERLTIRDGIMIADDGSSVGFGELVGNEVLHVAAQPTSRFKEPSTYTVVGKPIARVDIPAKVTGGVAYVHDLRLPGMVHARVVRPPSYGARLAEVDAGSVETMPGVLKVVRDGSFLAVIAGREYQAVQAMWALAQAARWIDAEAGTARSSGDLRLSQEAAVARHHHPQSRHDREQQLRLFGHISSALPDARRDRTGLCGRALCGRQLDGVVARPGHVSVAPRARRACRPSARQGSLHPHGRFGLLRPQRRR